MEDVREVMIASAVRTPIGRFLGAFQHISAVELGALAIQEALNRARVGADRVDQIWMGNVLQAGSGQNPARQASLKAGVPAEASAATVNFVCGSGLMSVILAARSIKLGDAELAVAGGMENMTQAPYLLKQARSGYRSGDAPMLDSVMHDGLQCAVTNTAMGVTAERIADKYAIGREAQDVFALQSQHKAERAISESKFHDEIIPVDVRDRKGNISRIDKDEHPRGGSTLENLAQLKPSFESGGTVTAGNSSGINDGASAVVICSEAEAARYELKPLARICAYAHVGVEPQWMGIGPVPAIHMALRRAGMTLPDIDLLELNEAFAVQTLAVIEELGADPQRVNVHGGAIALGHPIGASGTRVLTTLLHAMAQRQARTGLAALCVGGGHGIAMIVERV